MPISSPKSIRSFQAGLRASGNASTSSTVPTRISTFRKSENSISPGRASLSAMMPRYCPVRSPMRRLRSFPSFPVFGRDAQAGFRSHPERPACAEDDVAGLDQAFGIAKLAVEFVHRLGHVVVIVLEPGAEDTGEDDGEPLRLYRGRRPLSSIPAAASIHCAEFVSTLFQAEAANGSLINPLRALRIAAL